MRWRVTWKSKFIAVLLILALCTPAFAIGQDKIGHFAVGSAIGWVGTTAGEWVLGIGHGKRIEGSV